MSTALALVPPKEKRPRRSPRKPNGIVVLDRRQVVELCGYVDPDTIKKLLKLPGFPQPFFDFSKRPRWLRRDIELWLRKRSKAAQFRETQMERK